jgi:hypothetical protein
VLPELSLTKNRRLSGAQEMSKLLSYSFTCFRACEDVSSTHSFLSLQLFGHWKIRAHFPLGDGIRLTSPLGRLTTGGVALICRAASSGHAPSKRVRAKTTDTLPPIFSVYNAIVGQMILGVADRGTVKSGKRRYRTSIKLYIPVMRLGI